MDHLSIQVLSVPTCGIHPGLLTVWLAIDETCPPSHIRSVGTARTISTSDECRILVSVHRLLYCNKSYNLAQQKNSFSGLSVVADAEKRGSDRPLVQFREQETREYVFVFQCNVAPRGRNSRTVIRVAESIWSWLGPNTKTESQAVVFPLVVKSML